MRDTILLVQFGDLGDTLLTIPAIRAIRLRFPSARLVLVGKAAPARAVRELGHVDAVVEVDKHRFDRPAGLLDPRALAGLLRVYLRLRRERASTAVLFHHLVTRWGAAKFALLLHASGASRRAGLDNGRGWFLTDSVPDRGFGTMHEAEYWLALAHLLGADGRLSLEAPITAADREIAARLLAPGTGRRFLAIHPGTGWYGPGRLWEPARFAKAARLVADRFPLTFVIVGSEQDAIPARVLRNDLGDQVVDLVGKTSVGELAAVLERCDVLLANDGGVAHLSAAVGTPAITVFGPSNDRAWRPLKGVVVAADLPCRPCFYRDFERGLPAGCATRECMSLVTPEMVAAAAIRCLSEKVMGDRPQAASGPAQERALVV